MKWLFGGKRLRELGVVGINRRNAEWMLPLNVRHRVPVVDDKLRMAELCEHIGVATPQTIAVLSSHAELGSLIEMVRSQNEFVIKPVRGAGGRGILVIVDRVDDRFIAADGNPFSLGDLRSHLADTLAGMFSIGGLPDRALLQKRVQGHSVFEPIAPRGLADIRIVLYRFEPALAMLRLPTFASKGRANLHQGGIGAGIDLTTGRTFHAMISGQSIRSHPDTGSSLLDWQIPFWGTILDMSRKAARAVGLGLVGMDIVIDKHEGPLLLEANARPGLAIQLANLCGLAGRMSEIDEMYATR